MPLRGWGKGEVPMLRGAHTWRGDQQGWGETFGGSEGNTASIFPIGSGPWGPKPKPSPPGCAKPRPCPPIPQGLFWHASPEPMPCPPCLIPDPPLRSFLALFYFWLLLWFGFALLLFQLYFYFFIIDKNHPKIGRASCRERV